MQLIMRQASVDFGLEASLPDVFRPGNTMRDVVWHRRDFTIVRTRDDKVYLFGENIMKSNVGACRWSL